MRWHCRIASTLATLALSVATATAANQEPFIATYYGPGYDGRTMGCGGTYWSTDPSIAAVGPSNYRRWPCGTEMLVEGPAGSVVVRRQDSCPGCHSTMIDLSDSASHAVCGTPAHTCRVTVTVLP